MPDAQWIENMKRIMLQAVEAGDPCDLIPGTVVSVSPAAVQIDQKTTVKGSQVLVPRRLTDHTETMVIPQLGEVDVTVKKWFEAGGTRVVIAKKGRPAISGAGTLVERRRSEHAAENRQYIETGICHPQAAVPDLPFERRKTAGLCGRKGSGAAGDILHSQYRTV